MQRDAIIALLTKHELPIPIAPAEADGLTVKHIHANEYDRVGLVILSGDKAVYIAHNRRPLIIPSEGLAAGKLEALVDYCRSLDHTGCYGMAAEAEDAFELALRAENKAQKEASERRTLAYLIGKFGPPAAHQREEQHRANQGHQ
jgi:hypothetical protein